MFYLGERTEVATRVCALEARSFLSLKIDPHPSPSGHDGTAYEQQIATPSVRKA